MSSSSSSICIPTKIIQFIIVLLYINIIYALTLSSSIFNNNSHPSNVITLKPKPRKCHMIHQITANNTNNMKSKCKKIKDNFSPSLSFLRNTNCYKGTYTHDPPIPDELKNEKTNRKKIIELHLHSFYSRHHFNHNNFVFMNKEETNMNNVPTLLSHRFETMPYNKILKQYINAFNQELDHIIETKQHSNPFHIDGHIRTFYPKIPNNVFDILNVCGNNNITSTSSSSSNNNNNNTKEKNDLEHFPKLTLLLKQIVNKIEEMTWNMFQNNFMKNHQLEKEHHNDHLRCFELFASHTNIETVNLHCDTANTYQKNIQIVAWVPLYDVIMNPLIIKDNGGTETSLCDDDVLTDVHDGNNNNIFYTTSGMKAGEFLIYLNPSTTKENRTMLLNESPFHGSANITQSPIPFHDLKHHRILINMNVFNVDIIHGW